MTTTERPNGINHVLAALVTISGNDPSPQGFVYSKHVGQLNAKYRYGVDEGRKYHKVWFATGPKQDGTDGKSIVVFVDLLDGIVYRANSWNKRGRRLCSVADLLAEGELARNCNPF